MKPHRYLWVITGWLISTLHTQGHGVTPGMEPAFWGSCLAVKITHQEEEGEVYQGGARFGAVLPLGSWNLCGEGFYLFPRHKAGAADALLWTVAFQKGVSLGSFMHLGLFLGWEWGKFEQRYQELTKYDFQGGGPFCALSLACYPTERWVLHALVALSSLVGHWHVHPERWEWGVKPNFRGDGFIYQRQARIGVDRIWPRALCGDFFLGLGFEMQSWDKQHKFVFPGSKSLFASNLHDTFMYALNVQAGITW